MSSWVSWITVGLIVAVLFYAIFSVYLKKPMGLYIAALFHIALGILSLPSIGLYVFGLATLEIIAGIAMIVKYRGKRTN
ncbi:hypothetical protein ACFSKI_13355 [Pseudogracilibacillus auburnensis]|uniref:Uncharacterized protein n=1 Tax=Pseudogracilibacillus auburnensis TaxID=1494959 RepID=A0A2V3W7Z6_9BACI|nr:hypothetical protein [Pseudogracilibacillus auburnensis]PXW90467.1 hypothetical protein DFR56_101379 [Pseudogracilibacillus auburnensis]